MKVAKTCTCDAPLYGADAFGEHESCLWCGRLRTVPAAFPPPPPEVQSVKRRERELRQKAREANA